MTCRACNNTGRLRDISGAGEDLIPCLACQRYCRDCGEWVSKDGHECEPPDGMNGRDDRDTRPPYEIGAERFPPRE